MIESEEKKYFLPLIVGEDKIFPANAKPEDFETWTIKGKKQKVYPIPVSREVYLAATRDDEREKKRLQRQMEKAKTEGEMYAPPLTLDDFEIESRESASALDYIDAKVSFENLEPQIRKTHPQYAIILQLVFEGKTQREIAAALGKSVSTINEQISRAIKLFRELGDK